MDQGGGHRDVGDDCGITFVDGGEGRDVTFASFFHADGQVVVGPIVGDFTFGFFDCGGEFDFGDFSVVADNDVLRLVHDDVFDLECTVNVNAFEVGAVRGTSDEAANSEGVVANHAGALNLECEDGSSVASIVLQIVVERVHSEDVASDNVASDDPRVTFSAFAEFE